MRLRSGWGVGGCDRGGVGGVWAAGAAALGVTVVGRCHRNRGAAQAAVEAYADELAALCLELLTVVAPPLAGRRAALRARVAKGLGMRAKGDPVLPPGVLRKFKNCVASAHVGAVTSA